MDRSSTPASTNDHQPTTWPAPQDGSSGPAGRGTNQHGSKWNSGEAPLVAGGPAPSRLGQAIRRFIPSANPAIGAEPAYSTGGGGGFRSGNRPEPPARSGPNSPVRGGGPPSSGGPTGGGSGGGGPRMPRGGSGNPGPRPERYWTDYLRIALPIIGLILMLSVFIFWVGSIIDGNNDDADVTPSAVALEQTLAPSDGAVTAPTATVVATQSAAPSDADDTDPSPTAEASDAGDTEPTTAPEADESTAPEEDPTEEPAADATDPPADGAAFAVDDVVVTSESVNLRSEASDADPGTILRTLDAGTELTVIGEPENDGEFDWYPLSDADGEGYVREDFLEAAAG